LLLTRLPNNPVQMAREQPVWLSMETPMETSQTIQFPIPRKLLSLGGK
jgi:hypothetical protein